MKKLPITLALAAFVCLVGAGAVLTSQAQSESAAKMAATKSGGAKLYRQNCSSCHGAGGEGSDACCMMMSGPNLLSAVLEMSPRRFVMKSGMLEKLICALVISSIFHPLMWRQFGITSCDFPSKQGRTEVP